MTGVMLDHSAAPMLPSTMYGRVCPISGNGCRGGGPRGSRPCQRALRVPRARRKYAKGVGCSHAYLAGVGRGGERFRRDARVGRFDDVMGARARRKPALSLGWLNSWHTINALGWVCLLSIPDSLVCDIIQKIILMGEACPSYSCTPLL
jgi:hypothetical protein